MNFEIEDGIESTVTIDISQALSERPGAGRAEMDRVGIDCRHIEEIRPHDCDPQQRMTVHV